MENYIGKEEILNSDEIIDFINKTKNTYYQQTGETPRIMFMSSRLGDILFRGDTFSGRMDTFSKIGLNHIILKEYESEELGFAFSNETTNFPDYGLLTHCYEIVYQTIIEERVRYEQQYMNEPITVFISSALLQQLDEAAPLMIKNPDRVLAWIALHDLPIKIYESEDMGFAFVPKIETCNAEDNDQTIKADAGKLRISLVPTEIIRAIARVREYGVKKYGEKESWKKVELERYKDALLRHTLAFMDDENSVDEESGLRHIEHMACNTAFILELLKQGKNDKLNTLL